MTINAQQALEVYRNAEQIYSPKEVKAAYDRMAAEITQQLGEREVPEPLEPVDGVLM